MGGGVASIEEEVERYRGYAKLLRNQIVDSVTFIHEDIDRGSRVLVEGANAALLDIDFGTYPFVTSSNTTVGGVCTGLGVPPRVIDYTVGVVKAYTTRVGFGPFPTELQDEQQTLDDYFEEYIGDDQRFERPGHKSGPYVLEKGSQVKVGEMLQEVGREYGTTTGRRRRCGWLDLPLVKYSAMINGFNSISITKLDVLSGLKQISKRLSASMRHWTVGLVTYPNAEHSPTFPKPRSVMCCGYRSSLVPPSPLSG